MKARDSHSADALTPLDLKRESGIPAGYEVVAPLVVGVPADAPPLAVRTDPEIRSWM